MKMLRKRIVASILALTMVVSSIQFSQYTVYAEEIADEVSETIIADSGVGDTEEGNASEDIEEIIEDDSEEQDLEENSEESNPDGQDEVDSPEQENADDSGDETEDPKETDVEYEAVETEKNEEVDTVDFEEKLVSEKADLNSIYQLGGAPSSKDMEVNFSIESDGESAEVHEVNGIAIEDYLYQEILKRNPTIDVSEYNIEYELKKVSLLVNGVINEHPDLYFAKPLQHWRNPNNGTWAQVDVVYDDTLDDAAFQRETRTALSVVKEEMTDLQKAIVLHDYLAVNCEYDYENYLAEMNKTGSVPAVSHSAYGPLVKRVAVCDGYALAYKYLLDQVGIDCYMVTSEKMAHAWNLIVLNGKYYQVDVTWDDPAWDLIGRVCHQYMFCSDAAFTNYKDEAHYDWDVTEGSNVVDYEATDTTYDDAFWIDVNSPLVMTGNKWNDCYFINFDSDAFIAEINKIDMLDISNKETNIYNIGLWPVWEDSRYWGGAFSGLFQNNNRLYFNDATSIYSINFEGKDKKTEFTADTSSGYIYGSALCQGKVYYSLHQTWDYDEREEVLEATIEIQEEEPGDVPVESVTLDYYKLELEEGEITTLNATVTPSYATNPEVTWSSSEESVATVDNGTVTAVGEGECTITATAESGEKAECKVKVTKTVIPVESITLDKSSLDLEEGEVITIQATVMPDNATDKTVTWVSSNDEIATVKDGEVTSIKEGECTITAIAGGKSADCNIAVGPFAPQDSIASGISQKIRWFIDEEGKLTVKGSGDFSSASLSRKAPWYEHRASIISAEINVTGMTDASYMFGECENLASIDMSRFDTSQVTNMRGMFIGCYGLTSINWGNFDTGQVTDMSWMFAQCTNLDNLDLSSFNTGKVKNMANMFDSCSNLSSIDISSFNTDNVTNMNEMFSDCLKLTDLNLSHFDTSKVTDMSGMFSSCVNLVSLNLSGFDMTNVSINKSNMLGGCTKLEVIHTPCKLNISVELPKRTDEFWRQPDETEITELPTNLSESIIIFKSKKEIIYDTDIASGSYGDATWVIDKDGKLTVRGTGDFADPINGDSSVDGSLSEGRAPWYQYRDSIISAEVNITGMTDASYMFYGCGNLITLNISGFDTSKITNMNSMFSGCNSLNDLNLSGLDTSQVTNMNSMFSGCSSLASLNLGNLNTQRVTDMGAMFKDCSSLNTLDVSDFNTSQVKDIASMFNNCSNLTSLDLGNFDLSNVEETKVSGVLAGCTSLASINAPLNLSHLVALPVESGYRWCQPDEEETTVLPQNLSNSIEIQKKKIELIDPYITVTKTKTSYECDDIINIDDLMVEYHDERGKVTTVADYSTNVAEIDMSIAGAKTLVVTYRGMTYEIELTVTKKSDDNTEPENKEGLKVELAEPNNTYTYTGYPITPKINVTNNGEPIYEGVDYTVKYTNNIKTSDTAKIVVTGKGNLTGSTSKEFTIEAKWLDNRDVDDANDTRPNVEGDYITVVEGSKISPALFYCDVKLTAKDFKFVNDKYKSYTWKNEDNNTEISIEGQGNFQGIRKLNVIVIPKSEQRNYKIAVTITDSKAIKNLTYNGKPQNIDDFIKVSTKNAQDASDDAENGLKKNIDYKIYYPEDITSAGTKKVTIVGISDRCIGSVTKSYTIKPAKGGSLEVNGVKASYDFLSTGVTFGKEVTVKYKDADNNISEPLTEGVDYKITYSNNKKAGTAKYMVTGLGSYKGNKKTDSFNINPLPLNNNPAYSGGVTDKLKIVVGDKVFKKPGVYKSVPYVSINGVLLKASNYKLEYYLDNPLENPNARVMDNKNNKVTNVNGDTTVWIKITGKDKGNYATTDSTCCAVVSYKVRSMTESGSSYDLSKAKIFFQNKEGNPIKKVDFTGNPIDGDDINVVVTYKVGRETITLTEGRDYQVEFVNNVYKGKASVVITGLDNQTQYVGSKTATFSITANNIKNTLKWFGATS